MNGDCVVLYQELVTMMSNNAYINHVLDIKSTILDCLAKLENIETKTIFLMSEDKLVGSITDGDIRRWIVSGGSLDSSLEKICNLNPILVKNNEKLNAFFLMDQHKINAIPVVDDSLRIMDILFKNVQEIKAKNFSLVNTTVVIQAGGLGSRLKPITNVIPKALYPINGKPITEIIINSFKSYGIVNFGIISNYKKNMIKAYFEESDLVNNITYYEEERPLGTIGGLALLSQNVDSNFILTYCDTIIDVDYSRLMQFHEENMNDLTIVAIVREEQMDYGILRVNDKGQFLSIEEKPVDSHMVNSGVFVFSQRVFKFFSSPIRMDSLELIQNMQSASMKIGYFPVSESSWYDFGNLDAIELNSKRILNSSLQHLFKD